MTGVWQRREIALAAAVLLCFGLTSLPWIGKLGMEYDEAHFLTHAVKIAFGAEEIVKPPYGVTLAHRPLPAMTMAYVGALDAYVYAAAYWFFGTDPLVSRLVNLGFGLLIFGLSYAVVRREAGVWAGALAMGLLLADVELTIHLALNYGPILLQQAFTMGAVLCLQKWWKGAGGWCFFGAVTLMALSFHEKLTYLWIAGPLLGAALVLYGKQSWTRSRWWYAPAALVWAVAIVSPILYFVFHAPDTFGFGAQNTRLPIAWRPIVMERWRMFDAMLRGVNTLGFAGIPPDELWRGYWLHMLFGGGLLTALWKRQRMALLLYATSIGVWCANLLFPDAGRMHHLLLMAPMWQCGAAIGLAGAGRVVRYLACAVLLLAGWDATRSYAWFSAAAARTGGMHHWSDMTVKATRWLEGHAELQASTPAWGIARTVYVLSGGKIGVAEPDIENGGPGLAERGRMVWLVSDVMPAYEERWRRVVALSKKPPAEVAEFPSRDGRFHIRAYRFDLPETAVARWEPAGGLEFSLPAKWESIRFAISGVADAAPEAIELEWLDANGARLWRDWRPMEWTPHIADGASTLEFGRAFWPKTFNRTEERAGEARRVRITATLKKAKITMPEIGLR